MKQLANLSIAGLLQTGLAFRYKSRCVCNNTPKASAANGR